MSEQIKVSESTEFEDGFAEAVSNLKGDAPELPAIPEIDKTPDEEHQEGQGPLENQPLVEKEPETPTDVTPERKESETQADWEQRYKSMFGRYRKLQDEYSKLEAERLPAAPGPTDQVVKKAVIPEDQKWAVDEFKTQYPEYSDLVEMEGKEGDAIRKVLEEVGPDVAVLKIENLLLKRDAETIKTDYMSRQIRDVEDARNTMVSTLTKDHPEEAAIIYGVGGEEADAFIQSVTDWAESLPYQEAVHNLRVIKSGSPHEVSKLLTDYKKAKTPSQNLKDSSVNDGMAVPTKRAVIPVPKVQKDDFEGGFKEAAARLAKERK